MKVLKGFGLGILSFLLFISLFIFGFVFMLDNTLLNPDFVATQVEKLDIKSIVREEIAKQLPPEAQQLAPAIDKVLVELEPWIKEQARTAIHSGYDYIQGKSQSLNIVIQLDPVKEKLRTTLRDTLMQQLPPQIKQLPPAQLEQYFNQYYQQFSQQIPPAIEINESTIPTEAWDSIAQVKQGFSYYRMAYWGLIGFMVVLVLGIIFIQRQVRGASRDLGITFLCYGAIEYAGVFVTKNLALPRLPLSEVPVSLQPWLSQLFRDLLSPLEMFSLGFLIGGIVLLIVSFVVPKPVED